MDLSGATILLTGGTGSFGNAFIERVVSRWADVVIRVYSRDELKQSEMRERFDSPQIRYLVGDVRNKTRLARAAQGCDFVVHAAAMAWQFNRKITFDPKTETFIGDGEANSFISRAKREPWTA